jgi:cytochrome c peroxidase
MFKFKAIYGAAFTLGIALFLQQGYLVYASAQAPAAPPVFVDVSRPAGIVNNRVVSLDLSIGQAWGDYDNDGWVDLYVTDSAGPNTLYHNNGDGTFSVSALQKSVALPQAYSAGATFADYDNDGWRDLFVANWGADNLFHNDQGRGFVDVTRSAGILDNGNSKTASWGDFDNDGYLDLYIANWSCYPKCGRPMEGDVDHLYRNNGDGTFRDVSEYLRSGLNGAGFVASFNDFDNDGDLDIYLVNDEFINGIGNNLWRNDGPGCTGWCFTQVAAQAGANSHLFGMGLAVGDYDNDLDLDYYFSNVGPMELLQNHGDGTFRETAKVAGVQAANGIGWGAVFFDYNNDGWRDLYLTIADTTDHEDVAANHLFHNNHNGTFTAVACNNESTDIRMSAGVAYADYNRDGWVDLLVGNMDEGYRLYRNQLGETTDAHWLAFDLIGSGRVNRDAVGARAYVTTPDGVTQMQDIIDGSSLGAGNELTLYFGVGSATRANVTIRWPNGDRQTFQNIGIDQRYRLRYSSQLDTQLEPQAHTVILKSTATAPEISSQAVNSAMTFAVLLLTGLGVLAIWLTTRSLGSRVLLAACVTLTGALVVVLLSGGWPQDSDSRLKQLMAEAGVHPPTSPAPPRAELVRLGEALFWDPELSGNRDISCATCHHPDKATGDNLSVSIGTLGQGLGELRVKLEERRDLIPRNAQPIFNLGYTDWKVLFWDGRVSGDLATGFNTPASDRLPTGLDNLLAAQAMFPVTSRDEMRGLRGDFDIFGNKNELAMLPDYAARPIWKALMKRLVAIPSYVDLFKAAYPDVPVDQLGFQHAANALSAYEAVVFTLEDSPFDLYLRGDQSVLSDQAKRGAILFYGEAGCATCHAGGLLTDQKFHNLAVPQVGDGKGREQPFDLGRARETGNDCDRYAFRTPPLRNVALTGPYMHDGAFLTLEEAVRHHLDPVADLQNYDPSQLSILVRDTCQNQPETIAAILASKSDVATEHVQLSDQDIQDLLAFLNALTAPSAQHLENTIPASVPSGLPVGGNLENLPTVQQGR